MACINIIFAGEPAGAAVLLPFPTGDPAGDRHPNSAHGATHHRAGLPSQHPCQLPHHRDKEALE